MRTHRLSFFIILLIALAVSIFTSCSGRSGANRPLPKSTADSIAGQIDIQSPNTQSNARTVSENIIISGSDWFTDFGKSENASVNANLMMLEAGPSKDYSWASYRFIGLKSYKPKSVEVKVAPYKNSVWYVGVANYTKGAWQWRGPYKSNSALVTLDDSSVYVNNFNTTIVVVSTSNTVAIDSITLGSSSPVPKRFIDGRVVDEKGEGVANAKISVSEMPDTWTLTNDKGEYSLQDLTDGVYTLVASKIDYVFLPAIYPIRLVNTVAKGINFTGQKEVGFRIGGKVEDKDKLLGISNSLVFLVPSGLRVSTNATGEFMFKNLPTGKYLVRVVDSRYNFDTTEQNIEITVESNLNVNFQGSKATYKTGSINGTIVDSNGSYVQFIRNSLDPTEKLSITNEKGALEFLDCSDGSYSVTPTSSIMTFSPMMRDISIAGDSVSGVDFVSSPDLPGFGSISGKAVDKESGLPVANTTVYLDMGTNQIWTTTNELGEYSFSNLKPFTYTVFSRLPGYTWEPINYSVFVNGTSEFGKDFKGTYFPGKYGIYGSVVNEDDQPTPDVYVTLYPVMKTAKTDMNGDYAFSKIPAGSYYVAINEPNYTYVPPAIDVVMANADVKNIDFKRTLGNGGEYSIKGTVRKLNGDPLDKIMVYLSTSTDLLFTYSDAQGNYSFSNLNEGDYIVEPSNSIYKFNPLYKTVSLKTSDQLSIDFTGEVKGRSISGWIFDANELPLDGAVVVLKPGSASYTTSAGGYFIFNDLPEGLYELTPYADNYRFAPLNRYVDLKESSVPNQNFIGERGNGGQYFISGVFLEKDTYNWISGQKLTLLPDKYIRYTDLDGSFVFPNLLPGTYKIVYESSSFDYTPLELDVTITNSDKKGLYVEGIPGLGSVSGVITEKNGEPFIGCVVVMQPGDFKTYTNIKGYYQFNKVKSGKYTVTPSFSMYTFTPNATDITSNNDDLKNIDFKAN